MMQHFSCKKDCFTKRNGLPGTRKPEKWEKSGDGLLRFFKTVHPVGFAVVDEKDDAAAGPGDGIGPGYGGQFIDDWQRQADISNPHKAPEDQHGVHGH